MKLFFLGLLLLQGEHLRIEVLKTANPLNFDGMFQHVFVTLSSSRAAAPNHYSAKIFDKDRLYMVLFIRMACHLASAMYNPTLCDTLCKSMRYTKT